jgi:putative transposase
VKFAFIAKHRGIWPAEWLCGALGVSRGGFYAWLTRPRSQRSRRDEELGAKVRASFLASDRTYAPGGCGTTCWRKACRVDCIGSSV